MDVPVGQPIHVVRRSPLFVQVRYLMYAPRPRRMWRVCGVCGACVAVCTLRHRRLGKFYVCWCVRSLIIGSE